MKFKDTLPHLDLKVIPKEEMRNGWSNDNLTGVRTYFPDVQCSHNILVTKTILPKDD
jgi:hypothetical protein